MVLPPAAHGPDHRSRERSAAALCAFAPFCYTAGATVGGSLAGSFATGRAHYLRLVALLLVCIGVIMAGALALGVGSLVSIPVAILTVAAAYRTVNGETGATRDAHGSANKR
ncbi:hypothetical protein M0E87_08090 [Corynebacterium sp. CCM 9185]|uniref:Uncharacterized protein n=1 Tax=Corynebacterium marambiense TaxID=2765364 RepID=A0ABS0VU22_9CORY|nr:hypothetical protein [Corynebacterium marambiense]MBI9000266.1 hypothetical protein [Corynebacterium marambiense]MCK7663620.1 hypothetical protein [Corynebacterium marambiense]